MIKFFSKIRMRLLSQRRFSKYLIYAVGEIILVVIGILLALQVNNWNEERLQDNQFKATLRHVLTSLHSELYELRNDSTEIHLQLNEIDLLLNTPDSIAPYELPVVLFHLTMDYTDYKIVETAFHINNIEYKNIKPEQQDIVEQAVRFVEQTNLDILPFEERIRKSLDNIYLPYPQIHPDNVNDFDLNAIDYYDSLDLRNARELVKSREFRSILKSANTIFKWEFMVLDNTISTGETLKKSIRKHYPDLQLLYKDVGIIGTSLDGFNDVGGKSTPMEETNEKDGIWELNLYLKSGEVKFRCRNSWAQNWGGDNFPKGKADWHGDNIKVKEPGMYHITLNISQGTYNFKKLSD